MGRACSETPLHSTPYWKQGLSAPQRIAGVRKVVTAPQLGQVAALLPAIHCSAKNGFAGAPFRNMLSCVVEAMSKKKKVTEAKGRGPFTVRLYVKVT
ncbi:MAG TPA: hypothetical protein VE710_11155 [Candidatus Bathyarchaeia archaeon]|nr:hypothetical protein [Candidatus Bathyarchaeia archaeon]